MTAQEAARAFALLDRLRTRSWCFDLLNQFFHRAHAEDNLEQMRGAFNAMDILHRGKP